MLDGIAADAPAMARYPGPVSFVAGYVDGLYRWSAADWALFPNSTHVRIAVFADTDDGIVLDCEPGNCTPAQSVDWVLLRRRAGVDPTVYCNQLDPDVGWPAVRAAFRARGVAEPHYWVANYSVDQAHPQIPAGAVGLQYRDAGSYDLSVVADYWPGVDDPLEADMPLSAQEIKAVADEVLGRLIPRQGGGPAGPTNLAGMVGFNDGHVQRLADAIAAVNAAVGSLGSKVDALKLGGVDEAKLAADLAALIEPHLSAGSDANVIAAAVLTHLSAATANAKP